MKITFTILLFASFSICNAQNSVNASGGNASGSLGSLSYSIGQVFQETVISGSNSMIEGVQQPFEIMTLGVDDFASITVEMRIYPNPTTSMLFLQYPDYSKNTSKYELFEYSGKLIKTGKVQNRETQIDLQNNLSGMYILKVSKENQVLKTFKIIKK